MKNSGQDQGMTDSAPAAAEMIDMEVREEEMTGMEVMEEEEEAVLTVTTQETLLQQKDMATETAIEDPEDIILMGNKDILMVDNKLRFLSKWST
jgi:hypothetical protein